MLLLFQNNPLELFYQNLWLSAVIVNYLSLSIVFFQGTFPSHRHPTLASQVRDGLHQLWGLLWLLSVAFFYQFFLFLVLLLLYRECYRCKKKCFTIRCFLPYTTSPHLIHTLTQPVFVKIFLWDDSSSVKFAGLPVVLQKARAICLSVCLNHTVFHKHLVSQELYLNLKKYDDKLLLMNG